MPSWPWPLTPWSKINGVPPLIVHNLTCEVWKWLGKNCSLYHVHKVLYTEGHSWPWPLTPWPKINRVPSLIVHNLHVKFESDLAKTVVAVSTRQSAMNRWSDTHTQPLTNSRITISPQTLLWGDNKESDTQCDLLYITPKLGIVFSVFVLLSVANLNLVNFWTVELHMWYELSL